MTATVDLASPPGEVRYFAQKPIPAALGTIFVVPKPFSSQAERFDGPAELPRVEVDTTFPTVTGTTHNVTTTGQFTTALAAAVDGDEIVIGANLTYTINLPNRGTTGTVLIRSDHSSWASAGSTRVTSNTNMRTITATGSPLRAVTTATAARGYRFVGIDFKFPSGDSTGVKTTLCEIGNNESSLTDLPSYIIFDRCYIHGDATNHGRRGIAMNGIHCAAINCNIFDINEIGSDSQCIWAYNTPGPLLVENCLLYGGAENFMTGGANSPITGLIPSDITIRKCHFKRNLAWEDVETGLKNLFELKVGKRVLVEKCLFENFWVAGQLFAWNIKTVNQDAVAPGTLSYWNVTQDVTLRHNKVKNAESGMSLAQRENAYSLSTNRIRIRNNIFEVKDVASPAPSENRWANWLGDMDDISIVHNTIVNTGSTPQGVYFESATANGCNRFEFVDNILHGDLTGPGTDGEALMDSNCATYTCTNNAFIAGTQTYSGTNVKPADNAATFTNVGTGDYTVKAGSAAKNAASDGTDMGADVAAVNAYASAAEAG